LDFGFADFSTSKAFLKLAEQEPDADAKKHLLEDAQKLSSRAERAVKSLFDKQHGLMVPKTSSGQIRGGFEEIEWGNGYTGE